MNRGFWSKLNNPIMALAPMANVTDAAMRKIIAKYGKPDVMFTEFVSADGLVSKGREKLLVDFWYEEGQRPIVAQIFGSKPENIFKAAQIVRRLKFDGLDINMGCPDRAVLKQGAGGALIKNPKLAQEIIQAAKEGAGDLPVSVKTRIGFGKPVIEEWLPVLASQGLAAIIVHLRTVKEMSDVPAHWEVMPEIVDLVRGRPSEDGPLILGNGDVMSILEAEEKCKQTGCDGVMLGRAIFGNPRLFRDKDHYGNIESRIGVRDKLNSASLLRDPESSSGLREKMRVMLEHTFLFEKMFKDIKNFDIMKKHYKAYVSGFDGAKELRAKLMGAKTAREVLEIVGVTA
ncbi:MAG: tRNA-dihydrouridine synthase [Candidatus Doudnabacteria bacterium]|nr:tRNA-dihydrouridine synthase [Candidatus Doudnabacteria bacterium]